MTCRRAGRCASSRLPSVPVWNSPLLAGLFVFLLTVEWLLRRRLGWL